MYLLKKDAVSRHDSFIEASLGSEQYQSVNSQMAWSYDRRKVGDVKLLRTAVFECSRSGNRSTVLGVRLRFGFAMPPFCGAPRRNGRDVDCRQAERFSVERFVSGEEAFLEQAATVLGQAA